MKFRGKYLGLVLKYRLVILLLRKSPERAFLLAARKACTKICLQLNDVTDPLYFLTSTFLKRTKDIFIFNFRN